GIAFGIAGLSAVPLGYLADHTRITFVFQLCSVLPAIGLLTIFLPGTERMKVA
ncbi:MAG TPA: MFS transporter, partial [Aestuariivirga sp.]|nr:MFS transporter [Aestuariivirga sp.]